MKKNFINLTSGLEAIDTYKFKLNDVSFIRIQSSHCEAHKWELMLNELDYNFLLSVAMGVDCIVHDYGSQTELSKAVYIGLEWIKFVLYKRWLGIDYNPIVKEKSVKEYFEKEYIKLSKKTRKRLDYFKKFLFTDEIKIRGVSNQTVFDNDYSYYRKLLEEAIHSFS